MKTTVKDLHLLPPALTLDVLAKFASRDEDDRDTINFKLELLNRETGRKFQFDYSGGILAFISPEDETAGNPEYAAANLHNRKLAFIRKRYLPGGQIPRTVADREPALSTILASSRPSSLDVIHSLVMDTRAGEETFADFCSDCGYDEDSRKAERTHDKCREQGREFRSVVGDLFTALEEMTQDL